MSETPRIFVSDSNIDQSSGFITIDDNENIHYLKNVLRIRPEQNIIVLDGKGNQYLSIVSSLNTSVITASVSEHIKLKSFPSFNINLIQSCIKPDKQDFIIQKSTELGINKIYNVISDHSNAKFKTESEINKKLIRWQKIALNAARQSKRLTIPNIEICLNLDQLLSKLLCNVNNSIIIAFIEDNNIITFKEVLRAFKTPVENIYIIVGPEGGWSKEEIMLFSKYNIITTNLGRNILRAETVPIVALGILIYEFEL